MLARGWNVYLIKIRFLLKHFLGCVKINTAYTPHAESIHFDDPNKHPYGIIKRFPPLHNNFNKLSFVRRKNEAAVALQTVGVFYDFFSVFQHSFCAVQETNLYLMGLPQQVTRQTRYARKNLPLSTPMHRISSSYV